ncbi:MAG: GGDEF domain-containing protein [Lachnospiraceae bacterium]|nr:GGDEF domain-containing protein [Lachnospiraceae bacterium]
MNSFIKLKGDAKRNFLQSKFEYYRKFNTYVVLFASLASITYFISDCQLFGRFAKETIIQRCFILVPLIAFLIVNSRCKNYLIMSIFSQFMGHMMMWCTIGAIYYLPDKTHASEGFIIMHLVFMALTYSAPFGLATISHCGVFLNIFVSHQFNHYANLDIMISLGLPCLLAIIATNYVMCEVYFDTYTTKHQLEDSLVLDPLTRVYNRHKISSITKDGKFNFGNTDVVSILMTDIDFFKQVNDTYGHDNGDIVLKAVANVINSCTRGNDYIVRWGGEEFVVIMPTCPIAEATNVADRIRAKVEATDTGVCPITISIGVAEYDQDNYHNAISQADKALYTAKETGRNKVVCYAE